MITVVHRTDGLHFTVKDSMVVEQAFPVAEWIWNPSITAPALAADSKYWLITGDSVSLMSPAQRAAVDAAELVAKRDALADLIDKPETYERAFALLVLDEINLLRIEHGLSQRTPAQLKTALRSRIDS